MNPPFAPIGATPESTRLGYASLKAARNIAGVNLVWPFWELAARATASDGRAGAVLPLSVAYLKNDVARAARRDIFARGSWELRFFDRAPDSLFGDDVKQRIALAFKRPGPAGLVRTTALRRWSAPQRAAALRFASEDGVDSTACGGSVPKIGSERERSAMARLVSAGGLLGEAAQRSCLALPADLDPGERTIAIAPTAYNWIGVFRSTVVATQARRGAAGKVAELTFTTPTLADAAYAVIASRVFLWYWRATGDLFHVPLSALTHAPFPLTLCSESAVARLGQAGRACWEAALALPVAATNRGITTLAYAPPPDSACMDDADRAVAEAFGLATEFVRFVREDARRLRVAGRSR